MTTDSIKLRLINQSTDCNNSQILIFQKSVGVGVEEIQHVAWQVIENLGVGWIHPFQYELALQVSAADSWGNYVQPLNSADGQHWTVTRDPSGDQLKQTGQASGPMEVQILNGLKQGAIDASIYRSGKLLATKAGVAPGLLATFLFKPQLWIGVASKVEEGDVLDSAILSSVNTQLDLTGLVSADIVLKGGGPGPTSLPYTFTLQNRKYAL